MDIAEQVRRHLPGKSIETVPIIDHYCQGYRHLFSNVQLYESFKYLHLGILSEIKRKSLNQISNLFDISSQKLHHCRIGSRSWGKPPRPRCIAF